MPSFLSLFRSKQRARSAPPASRHIWPGRHRSQSGVLPLGEGSQPDGTNEEVQPTKTPDDDDAVDARSFHESDEEINALDDGSPLERQVSNAPRGSHKSNEGSDHSRSHDGSQRESQPGSKRLKGFMARFRMTRSQDRSSASELLAQSIPQDAAQDPTTTDPVKKDIPPRDSLTHESEHGLDTQEQNRNVSAQTVQSQDSNQTTATVFRHPSQRIAMPINELQDEAFWSSLLNFNRGPSPTAHTVEPSDPFSDGKDIEPQHHQPAASSHYSGDRSQKQSETSGHTSTHTQAESEGQRFSAHQRSSKSHSSHNTPPPNATRVSSVSSHSSRTSRLSRVDPSRAAMAFEVLATQLKLSITLREDEPSIDRPDESQNAEEDGESGRRRRFRRVRPTQSNFTLGESSPPPASRLRRTKTFANLGRRSSPMSSLRGKSLDTIARLGGHSYLILPPDLAPAPLQLPACIVAMIMYLRRSAPHSTSLFVEPGDMKAATRLYNHFASQVLLAERDAHRIAMTMRIVAIPHIETESSSVAVLSVGYVFVELLAGLPNGILGSVRLYRVLHRIFLAAPANPGRVRLITLSIMALTSEMECAMICAVCGFLTGLLQATRRVREGSPTQPQTPGNPVRPVASSLQPDGLARVFGPLLIGRRRSRTAQRSVEQEIEEERIMRFLLDNWLGICRQLWEWTGPPGPPPMGKRE